MSIPPFLKRIARDYQEVLFWMPPALLAVFLAFKAIPHLDPRSGIDGFGQMFAMLVNVVGGIMVCFSAWLTKRNYLSVYSREDQLQLNYFILSKEITSEEKRALMLARAVDLLEWVLCFAFWRWVVF